jgi:signal transduction histidine kinase
MASGCQSSALLDEVARSAERISEIVKAVKSYTFMDQAPVQQVDVHDGLDNTLIMLRHKLKSDVMVKRDYAPDLPRIEAYGSELNQVWTNIIDNAVDAMGGQGEILIRTYQKSNDRIVVEITDNGPGIPPEVQKHIFEQFYTTKEPGQGTGLGLFISHNIITLRHKGRIEIESKPGETTFRVTLPLQLEREQG